MRAAFGAEMALYRDHAHEAVDAESLAALRSRCAELLSRELGFAVTPAEMMAAIRFRAYPDAAPALARLRELGLTLVCVSNWDYALPQVLDRCGLGGSLDAVVTSAGAGARKPDPAIFARALELAGCGPAEALHVGDTPEEDIAGAARGRDPGAAARPRRGRRRRRGRVAGRDRAASASVSDPFEISQGPPPASSPAVPSQPPPPTTPPLSEPVGAPPGGPPPPSGPAEPGILPPATWGPGRAFAAFAFVLAASIVFGVVVVAFDNDLESLAAGVAVQALLAGSLIFAAFLFATPGMRGLASAESLGLRRPLRKSVWLAIATYFGYIACAVVIALVLAPEQEDITRELGGDEGVLGTVIAGILIVIVAPVSEEIFFRGFFYPGLKKGMPVILAALLASVVWGLLHYTGAGTWGVVVQITVFGLWLSWLYERTGSIYPTIAVHILNNAVAFTFLVAS